MQVPFPPQPAGVPWPTHAWPEGRPDADVDEARLRGAIDRMLGQPPELGTTLAVVVVHRGRIIAEGYGPDTDEDTPLLSWSKAKSIVHALTGFAVADGLLQLDAPAPVPAWASTDRAAITLQHLLDMRDGLDFVEEYVEVGISNVVDMLFFAGKDDVAGYAASRPLAHPPGQVWSYSSGTTNIVSRIVGDAVGGRQADMEALLHDRLFRRIGMTSAVPRFDAAGTFIGSSFVDATARDYARFGTLYLRDGWWDGRRVLPAGWADHARTYTATDPDNGFEYGAHWWRWPDQPGSLAAHGYEGQYTIVLPARDAVVVRLGRTPAELRPNLIAVLRDLIEAIPVVGAAS